MIFNTIGWLLVAFAALMLLPMLVSIIYRESSYLSFLISAAVSAAVGVLFLALTRRHTKLIYAREGFIIVALSWIFILLIGALPFFISGEIASYVDAIFETVSGFTTTGASILTNVEALSHGMLFWRSFTHWIGGMGVLVFMMLFSNGMSDGSIHILRAEMAGPLVGKLTPRSRDTAKVLYLMYIVLSAIEFVLLLFGGMTVFDSLLHTFGTAGTGGFGIKVDSLGGYNAYLQWVIAIFMLLFGVNFNLYFLLLLKKFKPVFKNTELRTYLAIVAVSVAVISINIYPIYSNASDAIRASAVQVTSIITTTGYSSVDFNLWPSLSKAILLMLMFLGGCAGSTAGGLKCSRLVLLVKMLVKEIKHMIHPRSVSAVRFEGKEVDDRLQQSVGVYFAVYMLTIFSAFLLISFEPFDFETNFSAVVSCFNNIGPGLGAVGPAASFAIYSPFSKLLLSVAMLLGRLEIFPLIITFIPSTWMKNK